MESKQKIDGKKMTRVTIEISNHILDLIKAKAAKLSITYQEYIVKIIHIEAEKIRKEMELEENI